VWIERIARALDRVQRLPAYSMRMAASGES
jgi:hypothetical protein